MIYWILCSSFVSYGAYSVCAPILPLLFDERGIKGVYVGLTFSLYAVGAILWAPIVGIYLVDRIRPANLMGASLLIMGGSFVCFGFLCRLEDKTTILVVASCLRLIEGMASTTQWTAAVTKIAIAAKSPAEKEKYFGWNTAVFSVGVMMGPVIGSALF